MRFELATRSVTSPDSENVAPLELQDSLTLIPLGYFEDLSPLGGGGGGGLIWPPLRSRQLMDQLTRKLAQS